MKVGIKLHIRAWITDIIVGSGNGWLTGIVVPIHSQLVVKKNSACVKGRKGDIQNHFSLVLGKKNYLISLFINEHSTAKCPLALQKQALNTALSLLVSKIFLLTAALTAIHTTWKILL